MSHDTEAAYASSEVADIIMTNQNHFFGDYGTRGTWSVHACRWCDSCRKCNSYSSENCV